MSTLTDFLGFVFPMRRYTVSFAKHRGRQDAAVGLPLCEAAETVADRILAAENLQDTYPDIPKERVALIEWLKRKQRLFLGYLSELRNLGEEVLSSKMAEIHRTDTKLKAQWLSLKLKLNEAKEDLEEFDKLYPNYYRGCFVSSTAYCLFLVLAAVADLPFNMFAFRIFREQELFTIAVAAVVGMVIPIVAHWVGSCLRQPSRTKTDNGMMIVSSVLVILAILSIGLIRESYLKSQGKHSDLAITVLFIFLQYLFFGLATYLAYGVHDMRKKLDNQIDIYSKQLVKTQAQREELRERKHGELKEGYTLANMLLAQYAMANADAGGPLGKGASIKDIKLERPKVELKELDKDVPMEFQEFGSVS